MTDERIPDDQKKTIIDRRDPANKDRRQENADRIHEDAVGAHFDKGAALLQFQISELKKELSYKLEPLSQVATLLARHDERIHSLEGAMKCPILAHVEELSSLRTDTDECKKAIAAIFTLVNNLTNNQSNRTFEILKMLAIMLGGFVLAKYT